MNNILKNLDKAKVKNKMHTKNKIEFHGDKINEERLEQLKAEYSFLEAVLQKLSHPLFDIEVKTKNTICKSQYGSEPSGSAQLCWGEEIDWDYHGVIGSDLVELNEGTVGEAITKQDLDYLVLIRGTRYKGGRNPETKAMGLSDGPWWDEEIIIYSLK